MLTLVPKQVPQESYLLLPKHHPSLAPNMVKMGQSLSRRITREAWLQTKLHLLPPCLLSNIFLLSNNRNLFPVWNRVRQKLPITRAEGKPHKQERRCVRQGRCSHPRCRSLETRASRRTALHVRIAVFQKLNTPARAAQRASELSAFTEQLSFSDPQHLGVSMINSSLKSHSSAREFPAPPCSSSLDIS